MPNLLKRPHSADTQGRIQHISPASAGWKYVGFEVYCLTEAMHVEASSGSDEVCLVVLSGRLTISTDDDSWKAIGDRSSVFDKTAPFAVYLPPKTAFRVHAESASELAVCRAPAKGKYPARLIRPEDCRYEMRGSGTNQRYICNILFDNADAEHLLVCEVITPGGHWSSYPPHKHDADDGSNESQLEETYYHRIEPSQGFAFQRVYNDDRSLDESMAVNDHDVVLVPEGYHPVGAPHGYDLYYLNVMAGPRRRWVFRNDPDHEWIVSG